MEAASPAFADAEPFRLDFGVSEEPESCEEKPILRYERNGFIFIVALDVVTNTVDIHLATRRPETVERDWQVLLSEVKKQAEVELQNRRMIYSEYFA
jgi:hypothetical protein